MIIKLADYKAKYIVLEKVNQSAKVKEYIKSL